MKNMMFMFIFIFAAAANANTICVASIDAVLGLTQKGVVVEDVVINYDNSVTFVGIKKMHRGRQTNFSETEIEKVCRVLLNRDAELVDVRTYELLGIKNDITCTGRLPEGVCF